MIKKYYPSFYKKLVCLASSCPDNCCTQWEIPVDEKTREYYEKLEGDFGEEIRGRLTLDEDGDTVFCMENGRCPFLNERNLCEIRRRLGHGHTSEICRQHPDLIEEYDGYTEVCPSVSCPAAAKLIFSPDAEYPVHTETGGDEYLVYLLDMRNRLFAVLKKEEDLPRLFPEMLRLVCAGERDFARMHPQEDIAFDYDDETISPEELADARAQMTALFCRLEILTDEWRKLTDRCARAVPSGSDKVPDAEKKSFFAYLLYRYFTKAVNGYSSVAMLRLLIYTLDTLASFSGLSDTPFRDVCRLAGKEIEHNGDNLDAISCYFL